MKKDYGNANPLWVCLRVVGLRLVGFALVAFFAVLRVVDLRLVVVLRGDGSLVLYIPPLSPIIILRPNPLDSFLALPP